MSQKRIEWKPEKRKLKDLKPYDKNPRIIDEYGLNQLGESFDEIGVAQPININTDNTILSGHARWKKLMSEDESGDVLVLVPDRTLTPKQEEAVIVRMNKNIAGKWDWDILANQYEIEDLQKWGFTGADLSYFDNLEQIGNEDKIDEWTGMPEFTQEDASAHRTIKVHFATDHHVAEFAKLIGQSIGEKTKFIWHPEAKRAETAKYGYVDEEDELSS